MLSIETIVPRPQHLTNDPVETLPPRFSTLQRQQTFLEALQSLPACKVLVITGCRSLTLGVRNRSRVDTTNMNNPTRAAGMSTRISTTRVPVIAMRLASATTIQGA